MKRLLPLLVLSLVMLSSFVPSAMVSAGVDGHCPTITTLPATNVGDNSAKLNAYIDQPNTGLNNLILVGNTSEELGPLATNPQTFLYFQYGTRPGVYTHTTAHIIVSSPTQSFITTVTTLDPCTKYYARAVLSWPYAYQNYHTGPAGYLFSILSIGSQSTGMHGLGVGLGAGLTARNPGAYYTCPIIYGNEITFTTEGCQIRPLGQGSVGVGSGNSAVPSWPKPVGMSNIVVQSATIATPKVAPGEKVDITASVTNKSSANGDAKVTLYVNGQEMESQGVALAAGQTAPVHFYVSMNEPGTYTVQVGSVPAGSFTVDAFANNDFLIYGLIALFTIGIAVVIYMVTRKRTA
ncbi:MAG: hypothetical protein NTZ34_04510 [Chloroflexi bacterium]|nr:hypothetical protein [Chloroflexota bacterium]